MLTATFFVPEESLHGSDHCCGANVTAEETICSRPAYQEFVVHFKYVQNVLLEGIHTEIVNMCGTVAARAGNVPRCPIMATFASSPAAAAPHKHPNVPWQVAGRAATSDPTYGSYPT
jgi:hypothetical protein